MTDTPIHEDQQSAAADVVAQPETPPQEQPAPLDALREEVATYKNQLLRVAAEFENYKRRVDRERADWLAYANEKVLLDMLPILDDLDRSLAAAATAQNEDPMYAGIDMIRQKLRRTLEGYGVKPFDSVGQPFNVDLHEALMAVQRDDVPPHTVTEEVLRGYYLNDKVLRHAQVVVSAEQQ